LLLNIKNADLIRMEVIQKTQFSDIYTTYYKKSIFFVKSYVHDDMAAEDITIGAFVTLWEKMKEEKIKRLDVFLFTILKDRSLDYLKHEEVKRNAIASMADWQERELDIRLQSLAACDPEDIFSDDVRHIIAETLKTLPSQTRQIFIMSRFEEKSNKEISAIMNTSVKSVEYHITKALKVLRVALKDYLPLFYFFIYFKSNF